MCNHCTWSKVTNVKWCIQATSNHFGSGETNIRLMTVVFKMTTIAVGPPISEWRVPVYMVIQEPLFLCSTASMAGELRWWAPHKKSANGHKFLGLGGHGSAPTSSTLAVSKYLYYLSYDHVNPVPFTFLSNCGPTRACHVSKITNDNHTQKKILTIHSSCRLTNTWLIKQMAARPNPSA